ncbi:MAG: hypothetical protein JWQ14_2930 [Adhaeribacter sp.]|nr:hypothetical protein [Adhaeribacter sp.]
MNILYVKKYKEKYRIFCSSFLPLIYKNKSPWKKVGYGVVCVQVSLASRLVNNYDFIFYNRLPHLPAGNCLFPLRCRIRGRIHRLKNY